MARRQPRIIKMNFDLENQDEQELQDYINSQKEGRINPVEKAPVLDMKTNPRLTPPSPGEKVLPTEEKSEYWREELRRGKDPRDVLNQYLMDKLTQRERTLSPSVYESDTKDRKEASKDKMFMNLLKSGADLGASFGNRRHIDQKSEIPTSGFDPNIPIESMESSRKGIKDYRKEREGTSDIDQRVLMYLSDKKQKEEAAKSEAKLKMDIAKMRAENDPFKAMIFQMKQAEENRQKGEYEMKREKYTQEKEEKRRKYNPANVSEKLDRLGATEKTQVGFISEGLRALNDIENAELKGREENKSSSGIGKWLVDKSGAHPWRFSVLGDNPYTAAANRYKEFFGRMQSGGAIGEKEAQDFKDLIPTQFDTPEMADSKLNKMKDMFYNKANILGLDKQDIDELIGGRLIDATGRVSPDVNNMVIIEAPDGSRRQVPKSSMQKYLNKGGKLVK